MSRPQVTITLGRSGHVMENEVVKRRGSGSEGSHSDQGPSSGSKRSIRDRLGSNGDYSSSTKRQRREGDTRNSSQDMDGVRVNRNDLRYKLIRKNMSRRSGSDGEQPSNKDLREKLSRNAESKMRTSTRQHVDEPRSNGTMRRIPPTRSADDLRSMESLNKSYSSWTLDGLRRRSPDRIIGISRGLSPPRPRTMGSPPRPRTIGELRHISSSRPVDTARPAPFPSKGVFDASRPSSIMTKASIPADVSKPVVRYPAGPAPPSASGPIQKSLYTGEDPAGPPLTVASLLHSLGLGKYAILFQAEEVDMTALRQMGDQDLKELGIPMGPRKKILLSVMSRLRRQP
ncbi:hypothetical protein Scep_021541 [Stephania cephalantha]|uniref:SAM domain-containing protein n=1 Tax=Stephania cephalantha TaxID=152367 RepID=A0AAP0I0B1_9MAGN